MFRSIRWRLTLSYILLLLIAISLVGFVTLTLAERAIGQQEQAFLQTNAEAVAQEAERLLLSFPTFGALERLANGSAALGDVQVKIYDHNDRLLVNSGDPDQISSLAYLIPNNPNEDFLISELVDAFPEDDLNITTLDSSESLVIVERRGPFGERYLSFEQKSVDVALVEVTPESTEPRSDQVARVAIGDVATPLGYVELRNGQSFGGESLATMRRAFVIAGIAGILLAAVAGLLMGRGLTAPLQELTAAARQMGDGTLSARAPDQGKDEIGELSRQFNQMASQLESSFDDLQTERDALRRFIEDASHELRTPITALRNFNELLQGAAKEDVTAQTEFLAESERQLARLSWVTSNLLDLSRFDAGLTSLTLDEVDVNGWLSELVDRFMPIARSKEVTLHYKPSVPAFSLRLDAERMEMAVANLIDNAIKFTPAGGQVRLSAHLNGHEGQISVRDGGPGIPADEAPHIFKRFYRGAAAREQEGSGLGLAIVRSVAQAHGGWVEVNDLAEGGAEFVVSLPAVANLKFDKAGNW